MWIDCDHTTTVGTIGFRVEAIDNNHGGASRWYLRESPQRTNVSGVPKLTGWCGETNNISRFARGLVRVVKINSAGDRARVDVLTGAALATALEELGYPELTPDGVGSEESARG